MRSIKKFKEALKTGSKDNSIAGYFSSIMLAAQRNAADYLNRKTAGWSPRRTKTILILFCMVTGNICLFIAGRAILSANGPPKTARVQRLYAPRSVIKPGYKLLQNGDSTGK